MLVMLLPLQQFLCFGNKGTIFTANTSTGHMVLPMDNNIDGDLKVTGTIYNGGGDTSVDQGSEIAGTNEITLPSSSSGSDSNTQSDGNNFQLRS